MKVKLKANETKTVNLTRTGPVQDLTASIKDHTKVPKGGFPVVQLKVIKADGEVFRTFPYVQSIGFSISAIPVGSFKVELTNTSDKPATLTVEVMSPS